MDVEPALHPSFAELIRSLSPSEVLVELFTSRIHSADKRSPAFRERARWRVADFGP